MTRPKANSKKQHGIDFKVSSMAVAQFYYVRFCICNLEFFWSFLTRHFQIFQKIRRKVGRKLPPPKNTTNTEIKSKGTLLLQN